MTTDEAPALCPNCGGPAAEDSSACSVCGTSLLLDVFAADPRIDARVGFQAARALANLGPPAPAFPQARERIVQGNVALVSGVSRPFATNVIRTLKASGVLAVSRPAQANSRRSKAPFAIGGLVLVCLVGVGFAVRRSQPVVPAPVDHAVAAIAEPPAVDAGTPTNRALTTQEIGKRVMASVAALKCDQTSGSGFFIGKERLVTNEHVVCPGDELVAVTLPDGRNLLGKVISRDEWADLAVLEVLGANATPLEVGDTTLLQAGDSMVFVGSPKGLDFTLHSGKVSFVGRNVLGLAYVQLNASINPGNSGGPLFNERGEVVGIVSMKAADADGIGFALPLEYALLPQDAAALARWKAVLARVAAEDRKEQDEERKRLEPGKAVLVGSKVIAGRGLAAVILQGWAAVPHGVVHEFTLDVRGQKNCSAKASFTSWMSLKDQKSLKQESRHFEWVLRNGIADRVFVGAGILESVDCSPAQLTEDAKLVFQEGGAERGKVTIDARQLHREAPRAEPTELVQARAIIAADQTNEEASWRARFRQAKQRLVQIEQSAEAARKEIERLDQLIAEGSHVLSASGRANYFRLKERVAGRDPEKAAAAAELHELERQAAFAAVPNEWRR